MATVIFKIGKLIDLDFAINEMKKSLETLFANKGREVIDKNIKAIDGALETLEEVDTGSMNINPDGDNNEEKTVFDLIIARKGNNIPIILVGNKKDLVNEREVNDIDVKKFAKEKKINYIETSAITGENCQETFYEISKLVYIQKYNVKNIYDEIRIKKCCCNII
jgi:GTPase SAR1 family protein